jgi:hypothetical protein
VAVSVLGAAYWFTRRPELVWWTSPEVGKTGRHVRVLIPTNWHMNVPLISEVRKGDGGANYFMSPVEGRPKVIRLLFPRNSETAKVGINVIYSKAEKTLWFKHDSGIFSYCWPRGKHIADRYISSPDGRIYVQVVYERSYLPAFNRTYRKICDSLRIE